MKIAYITQSYPPMISGASLVVKRLADNMARRGHKVMVLAASDRGHAYVEKVANLTVVRLKSIKNPKRANQNFIPGALNAIVTQLQVFQPDLIHTHDVMTLGIPALVAGRELDIPVVATLHQIPGFVSAYLPDFPGLKPSVEHILWEYNHWIAEQYQTIIVPTETISETIQEHGDFPTIAISNGVDLDHFTPVSPNRSKDVELWEKFGLDPELSIILHVGRLDGDKSVDVVIRAAAKVLQQVPAQLLVAGDGECRDDLIHLARQLGIDKNSHFPGFVDANTDLPGLYRMASVFVTASEIETQGLVLLEAMACGLPVVAVDATCIHEIVKHKENGYLVQPGDEDGITQGLLELLKNGEKAGQMGEAGRSIVQAHSVGQTIDQHEALYHENIRSYQGSGEDSLMEAIIALTGVDEMVHG